MTTIGNRLWTQKTTAGRLSYEGISVVAAAAGVSLLAPAIARGIAIDRDQVLDVLALLTVIVGSAAAGLGGAAGQLSGNRRAIWLIPALALYCVAIVPGPMLMPDDADPTASPRAGGIVATLGLIVLLIAAVSPPARLSQRAAWSTAAFFAVVALSLDVAAVRFPLSYPAMAPPLSLNVAVLVVWVVVATAVVVVGYVLRSPPLWRIGLGFGVVAAAHLYRLVGPASPADPGILFAALRLVGIAVVLLGTAQLLRRALTIVVGERFHHQEELRKAALRADELVRVGVVRDHEIRNGLSGLSGIAQLIARAELDDRHGPARTAALSEFDRLRRMLEDGRTLEDEGRSVATPSRYDAGQVIRELAALWTTAGLHIDASISGDLTVLGSHETLAQVMTTLLTNCSQHAPGARIEIVARRNDATVSVQVSDDGPRSRAGRTSPTGTAGGGIGLNVSRWMLRREGASLHTAAREPAGTGFTAVIELRTAPGQHAIVSPSARAHTAPGSAAI